MTRILVKIKNLQDFSGNQTFALPYFFYWLGRVVAGSARLLQIFHLPALVEGVGSGQQASFLNTLADLTNMCHVGRERHS